MEDVEIQTPKGSHPLAHGGIIDRMDSKDNVLRIVDYKTGGKADTPPSVESLFTPGPQTFQLRIPDFPVRRHRMPETA